jgi:hypothetical protein
MLNKLHSKDIPISRNEMQTNQKESSSLQISPFLFILFLFDRYSLPLLNKKTTKNGSSLYSCIILYNIAFKYVYYLFFESCR